MHLPRRFCQNWLRMCHQVSLGGREGGREGGRGRERDSTPLYRYKEGVLSEVEEKLERSDYFDGVDWKGIAVDKQFVFFQVRVIRVCLHYNEVGHDREWIPLAGISCWWRKGWRKGLKTWRD